MIKIKNRVTQTIGLVGGLIYLFVFVTNPSFPTPDKLALFLLFGFMAWGQAIEGIKRFSPFIILLLTYESFRSVADHLNKHVNFSLAPHADSLVFGNLPTVYLQDWLWHGQVRWYDTAIYLPYMLHFIIPLALGVLVWRTRDKYYWQVMNTFLVTAFASFLTFLLLPAAPPWLASQNHYIHHITRISSEVWAGLGLHDFPSFYNHIAPNDVAAVPSLHAAWATLLVIFVYKLYGRRWALLASLYPLTIFFGTVYEGEHYVFDVFVGVTYALAAYLATPKIMNFFKPSWDRLARFLKKSNPVIPEPLKNKTKNN